MKKIIITVLIIILLAVIGGVFYFYIGQPFLFIAKVNDQKIYLSDYQKILKASIYFYDLQKSKVLQQIDAKKDREYKNNLEKFILQNMIEDKIIEFELKNNFNIRNLNIYADQKIEKALLENQNIAKDVQFLYNLDLDSFKKLFLYSVAIREILNEQLQKQNVKNIDNWFLEKEQKYDIKIYLKNLKWDKEKGIVE